MRPTSLRLRERLSSMDKVDQACSVPAWLEYSDNRAKRVAFVLLVSTAKAKSRFVVKTVKELRAFWPELDGKLKDEIKSIVNAGSMGRDTSKSHKAAYFEKQRRALDVAFQNIPGSSRKNRSALSAFVKDKVSPPPRSRAGLSIAPQSLMSIRTNPDVPSNSPLYNGLGPLQPSASPGD